jgi:hypothetical protein
MSTRHGQQHPLQVSPIIVNYHKNKSLPKKEKNKNSLFCVQVCFIHNISSSSIHSIFPFSSTILHAEYLRGPSGKHFVTTQSKWVFLKYNPQIFPTWPQKSVTKDFLWKKSAKVTEIYLKSPYLDNRSPKYSKILLKYIFPL